VNVNNKLRVTGCRQKHAASCGFVETTGFSRITFYRYSNGIHTQSRIGLSSVLRPRQHSTGYMGDGFYRSKDPTNSIKVLKEQFIHKVSNVHV